MNTTLRTKIVIEVHPGNAEGPTTWRPKVPKESALVLLDDAIVEAEREVAHLKRMRALVADAKEW